MLLMKMTGVLLSLLPRSLLSLGKVGQSSRFCLVVLRIEPQYQLRHGILLVVRWDLQMRNLARVSGDSSARTGASGSSPPGEVPARRRVRTKGRGPHGPAPKVAVAPLAPEDDPDLQEYEPSLPEEPEVSSLEPIGGLRFHCLARRSQGPLHSISACWKS